MPWRSKGSVKPEPYHVWLSEIMLQQTTVVTVKDYFLKFLRMWPTVENLAAAHLDEVLKAWAGLGYYARARNLHKCAGVIVAHYGGQFPKTRDALAALPGIGAYTSAAIAAIAFDEPVAAIDGNVERVISRHFGIEVPLPASKTLIRAAAEPLVPDNRAGDFAQALMDLGATICRPKSPSCSQCPVQSDCTARLKGMAAILPFKAKKAKVPTRYAHVFWIENGRGKVLVRQRAATGLLGGMAEFPSTEWAQGKPVEFCQPFKGDWQRHEGMVTHTFTHFHLEMTVWKTVVEEAALEGRFISKKNLGDVALPTVMLKVARHVMAG